jgi:hypothetical protein
VLATMVCTMHDGPGGSGYPARRSWGRSTPDSIHSCHDDTDPEREVILVESIRLALLVVLETLSPAERLTFVLHDVFAVLFRLTNRLTGGWQRVRALRTRCQVLPGQSWSWWPTTMTLPTMPV